MASMNDLVVSIGADISNLRRDMGKMERTVSRSSGRMGKVFGAAFKLSNLTNAARGIKAIFDTITRAAAGPIMLFAQFDETMRFVAARSGATTKQLKALTEQARELGKETSFTAPEVAESMKALATVGMDPTQIQAMADGVLDVAKATGTELPLAAETASVLLKQFQLDASQASHVMDVMTFASNNSLLTVQKMSEAFRIFAPSAGEFNTSLEDAAAAAMVLANAGTAASTVGTGLRRILNTTATEAKAFEKEFGISFLDEKQEFVGLVEAMKRMDSQMNKMGLNATERAVKMKKAFSLLGVTSGVLLTKSIPQLIEFTRQLKGDELDGLAERSRDFIEGGMMGAIKRIQSAWDDFKLGFVAGLEEPLIKVFKHVTMGVKYLSSLIPDITGPIRKFIDYLFVKLQLIKEFGVEGFFATSIYEIDTVLEYLGMGIQFLGVKFANAIVWALQKAWDSIGSDTLRDAGMGAANVRPGTLLRDPNADPVPVEVKPEPPPTMDDIKARMLELFEKMEARRKEIEVEREKFAKRQEEEQRIKGLAKLAQQFIQGAARKAAFGTMADPTAKKKEVAPSEVHGFGGGAAEQLGSAAAYRKVFDYFTSQKKNKADQERNKILKQIEANTKGIGGDDDSGILGLPGEF